MTLRTVSLNQPHPRVPDSTREADINRIIIDEREVTLVLTVFYLIDDERVESTTIPNVQYILRATPDSNIYRNATTGAMMEYDENDPNCVQEYALFMAMLNQPVNIMQLAENIVLEYEQTGRYNG